MIKAVFDTNIIVSGLIASSGDPYEALEVWRRGEVILLVSEAIVDEVVSVLQRPFFRDKRHVGQSEITRVSHVLKTYAVVVSPETPETHLEVVEADPDDDRILECALDGGADYLVSGDHHLLDLKRFRGMPIVTAREFLAMLKSRAQQQEDA